jgi:hypothetical protein
MESTRISQLPKRVVENDTHIALLLTNKEIARQGYITLSSYYEQICEN